MKPESESRETGGAGIIGRAFRRSLVTLGVIAAIIAVAVYLTRMK